MRFARLLQLLCLCLLTAPATIATGKAATIETGAPAPSYFRSLEIRNDNLTPFPKWTGMLERMFAERGQTEGDCTSTDFNRCHYERWRSFVESQRGRDLDSQLEAVNRFMNEARYIVDPINWGVKDYWATPRQFLAKFGDCEDYAIAKFVTLKELGIAGDRLRIVVLQDLNLGVAHAVLAVLDGERTLILDNQIKQVVEAESIRHYRPIFSINEDAWWLHRPDKAPRQHASRKPAG